MSRQQCEFHHMHFHLPFARYLVLLQDEGHGRKRTYTSTRSTFRSTNTVDEERNALVNTTQAERSSVILVTSTRKGT